MDRFFTVSVCDRCKKKLTGSRIMSMFNTDVLCAKCKEEEKKRSDYRVAQIAERDALLQGMRNFPGIGYH